MAVIEERLGTLKEYVGSAIIGMSDGSKILMQPDRIKKLESVLGKKVANVRTASTPMKP
jgi:hypothetical protein